MSFRGFQFLECVRQREQSDWLEQPAQSIEEQLRQTSLSFKERALSRAEQLAPVIGVSEQLNRQQKLYSQLFIGLIAIMSVLGGLAVLQGFKQSQINVYWLLISLLGVNTFAMGFWGLAMAGKPTVRQSPLLALLRGLGKRTIKRLGLSPSTGYELLWSGQIGRWRSSVLIHLFWSAYLLAGLAVLLLIMLSQQIDFVWGTTILADPAFVAITQALAKLPAALSFAVPATEQILQTRIGRIPQDPESARYAWSGFLVGVMLLYGVVPRLLLAGFSAWRLRVARDLYQPDWSQPYFVRLRERLMPGVKPLGVVDPDTQQHPVDNAEKEMAELSAVEAEAAEQGFMFAYEWSPEYDWPIRADFKATDLGVAANREQQKQILVAVGSAPAPITVFVLLHQTVDRGFVRFVRELSAAGNHKVGLVVVEYQESPARQRRWHAWRHAAEQAGVIEQKIHLLKMVSQ